MSVDLPEGFYSIETSLEGQSNQLSTYVLSSDTSIIFDPGPASTVNSVINGLKASKIKSSDPLYVALSHIHLDHAGGSWRLLDTFHEAIIYVHPRGRQHIIDPSKLVEASRNLLGKEVVYKDMPEAQYREILISAGLPESLAKLLADSDRGASQGGLYDESRQLSQLIGRPTTLLKDSVAEFLASKP